MGFTMKFFVAFLLSIFSLNLLAECKTQALFIGYVKNLEILDSTEFAPERFSFELKVSPTYITSDECPMEPSEVEKIVFTYEGRPRWKNGDRLNVLMSWDEEKKAYVLDIYTGRTNPN